MVEFHLVPGYFKKEVKLSDKHLSTLSKYSSLAVFGAVQFINLDKMVAQLEEKGIKVRTTHGKRTSGQFQLLGCDCYSSSYEKDIFDADCILYVGDGLFHPKALLMAKKQPVLLFNPIADTLEMIDKKDIHAEMKKYKANVVQFMAASKIGVLVSTKTGQSYLKNAVAFKEASDKEVYLFVDDTFNYSHMENFPFIEVWVNTACPRIGFDDCRHMPKPLININDAMDPVKALENATTE